MLKRDPDYITSAGLRLWFEELKYLDRTGVIKSMMIADDGVTLISQNTRGSKFVPFATHIQERYKEWRDRQAENALLLDL